MKMKNSSLAIILLSVAQTYAAVPTTPQSPISSMTKAELDSAISTEVKKMIRVVDPSRVLQSAPQWKDEQLKLQAEGERRQKELEKLAMSAEKQKAELMNMGTTATKAVREAKEQEIFRITNDIQIKQKQGERAMQEMYEKAQMDLYKEIEEVMQEVAREMNIAIVHAGGLLYAEPGMDISDKIVDRLTKKHAEKKARQAKPAMSSPVKELASAPAKETSPAA